MDFLIRKRAQIKPRCVSQKDVSGTVCVWMRGSLHPSEVTVAFVKHEEEVHGSVTRPIQSLQL